MGQKTAISWCDATFNPWVGCAAISPGCEHCYAAARAKRVGDDFAVRRRTTPAYWRQPIHWNAASAKSGEPCRVFCASLADVFDNEAPCTWREDLWRLIRNTPALTWLLLTKRIGNVERMKPVLGWPANVWLGATVVNQEEADRDVPKLLRVGGVAKRFLSCEPLLGELHLTPYLDRGTEHMGHYEFPGIDWVIAGGESGGRARRVEQAWIRSLRDQCAAADVAFHFKQWGGVHAKANGRALDGAEHLAIPA